MVVARRRTPTPPPKQTASTASGRLFDGLGLLRHSYVLLLLMISTLYEVVLTVLDFEMKIVGRARFGGDTRGAEEFARLMGQFGIAVNSLSFLFSLFCFSFVVRRLGVAGTLIVFPLLCVAHGAHTKGNTTLAASQALPPSGTIVGESAENTPFLHSRFGP